MKSNQGEYYVGLDHIRAFAAFTVFSWHFNHVNNGHLQTLDFSPLSIFAEGHVGVAIFMTLSGYLFAKLLDGDQIKYFPFLWNRLLRLFPLLFVVMVVHAILNHESYSIKSFLEKLASGLVAPVWPNGGWSITVELHFYLVLPLLLAIARKSPLLMLSSILVSLFVRTYLWLDGGSVQSLAYWTIVGGIDQFVLGIFAYKCCDWISFRRDVAILVAILAISYMMVFDSLGGFYTNTGYPSPSPLWILHPTILGLASALLIAWYDKTFVFKDTGLSGFISSVGAWSYSIYLLHFFFVFKAASFVDRYILELTSFPLVLCASIICFFIFTPIAYLSFHYVEKPLLKYRVRYKR